MYLDYFVNDLPGWTKSGFCSRAAILYEKALDNVSKKLSRTAVRLRGDDEGNRPRPPCVFPTKGARRNTAMGLFFYFVMFVLTCGFGWWARGEKPNN